MKISKILSRNDVGSTGGHQSGVVVPKEIARGGFFPKLNEELINPRSEVRLISKHDGSLVRASFIFYNGKLHGTSTRNEFRLTGISSFLRFMGGQDGDTLILEKRPDGSILIELEEAEAPATGSNVLIKIGQWNMRGS